jgi:hypothetical protein
VSALSKGLIVGAAQILLLAGVGAKFLYDRATYPRLWVETAPYDPYLPVRGRYVSIALVVPAARVENADAAGTSPGMFSARLEVRDDQLVAVEDPEGKHFVTIGRCPDRSCLQLATPVAYFIPEHGPDPSRRPEGETLWVEVTLPPTGAPRPLRLGTRRAGDAKVTPLGAAS